MENKQYVKVITETDVEGRVQPVALIWKDGRKFNIDKVTDVRKAASTKAGGIGIRYSCMIYNKLVLLFFEDPRWFIEAR